MSRRPRVTKKINQVGVEGNNEDALLKHQPVNQNPPSIAKDGNPEARVNLTKVSVAEDGSLNGKSTRRSKRLLKATSRTEDFRIESEGGTVEIVLDGTDSSDAEAEQEFLQCPEVEKMESDKVERLFKLVEQQQMRIDELAAEKSLSFEDLVSLAEIGLKVKANKYKNMYAHAQRKIQGLQKKNHELTKKLECANAKLEGYEMGQLGMFEVIEKFRDASLFSALTKPTETIVELPSTGNGGSTPKRSPQTKKPQAAKRKNISDISKLSPETKYQAAKKKKVVIVEGVGSSLADTQK